MKIILVGLGKVGKNIVEELSKQGHEIICIDVSSEKVNQTIESNDVMGIVGNGANIDILKEANVKNSDCFIAATNQDEVNIMSCLVAKKLGAKDCVARIRNPEYHKQIDFMKNELGVNLAINPEKETALEIKRIIDFPSTLSVDTFANDADIIEYLVKEKSPIIGKSLISIRKELKVNVLFVAIKRGTETLIPNGNFKINAGDLINIMGERQEIINFLSEVNDLERKAKNILVIGGGKTSYYLLDFLSKGRYKVNLIESDKKRCEELSSLFPKISVINADGSDLKILENNGIKTADVIVALTALDETNFVIAMAAKDNGVKKVITKINRDSLAETLDKEEYAAVISPKHYITNKVLAHIKEIANPHGNHVLGLTKLVDEGIEAIIFKATDSCKFLNKQLKDIEFKPRYIIGSILRDKEVIIPRGSTEIKENDQVIVITSESVLEDINEIIK